MAKDSQRLEQEFISTIQAKTGRSLSEWLDVIKAAGLADKPNTILKWLKENHSLNHMQANFLAGIYLNDGKPVYDYPVLFAKIFTGKADQQQLYEALSQRIQQAVPDAEFIPTQAYVSIEAKRIFACATPTKDRLRVGLDLGDMPVDNVLQKAKSLGAMPNLTHMVEIISPADITDQVIGYVQQAYQRTHKAL